MTPAESIPQRSTSGSTCYVVFRSGSPGWFSLLVFPSGSPGWFSGWFSRLVLLVGFPGCFVWLGFSAGSADDSGAVRPQCQATPAFGPLATRKLVHLRGGCWLPVGVVWICVSSVGVVSLSLSLGAASEPPVRGFPQASSTGGGGRRPAPPVEEEPPACGRIRPLRRFSLSR